MLDYRSPATTTNHYLNSDATTAGASNLATLGHPADGVVISGGPTTATTHSAVVDPALTTGAHHSHHHGHHHGAAHGATTTTTTTATQQAVPAVAPMGSQVHHTLPSGATGDGLVLGSNIGGPLGGSVVMGGQCECTRNGGVCSHKAGQCTCRGCTTAATSVNPGINIGVSTHQYTAPVGTSGIAGGVTESGVGMAGVVNSTNPAGQPTSAALQNCNCVREKGVCKCKPGQCDCTNCTAHRKSLAATQASNANNTAYTSNTTTTTF